MIYVSSAAIRRESLTLAVKELAEHGLLNIELTAGNALSENWLEELLELKAKYKLNYLCHNYFPVPKNPFVLNLASLDETTHTNSVQLAKRAIEVSKQLGGTKYAIHAGFRIDIPVSQIGKKIEKIDFYNEEKCWQKFTETVNALYAETDGVELFIENNVLSKPNFESYEGVNPFYVTDENSWNSLKSAVPKSNLLLDVAHLKVSCNTLGLDFEKQLSSMAVQTNYIHLSDNDGLTDSNLPITENTMWLEQLKELNLSDNIVYTLEIYSKVNQILEVRDLVEKKLI